MATQEMIPAKMASGETVMVLKTHQGPTYTEEELYSYTGDEHDPKCQMHPENIGTKMQEWEQAREQAKADAKPFRMVKPKCEEMEGCCPADLVINAGAQPIIIGAQAQVPEDTAKIMPGDRRRGPYYLEVMKVPMFTGLQRLKDVAMKRRVELARMRQLRLGDRPDEWVREAWKNLKPEDRAKFEQEYGALEED